MAIINYNFSSTANNKLSVDDPGDCAIRAIDSEGDEHWLIMHSLRGMTSICSWGPVTGESTFHDYPPFFQLESKKHKYNYSFCIIEIQTFLSYRRKSGFGEVIVIESAEVSTIEKAKSCLAEVSDYVLDSFILKE